VRVRANGIAIEVDDAGPAGAEPLLLVMGLGMQLIGWPDELVALLQREGFRPIRFDNRDAGLSQGFDAAGVPNLAWASLKARLGLAVRGTAYTLDDMADDALGVLDALGIERAHVCGASMGGMVAQVLAARHAGRLKSLTLMMTTSGARRLPGPTWHAQRVLMERPRTAHIDARVEHLARVFAVIGSPAYPADPVRLRGRLRTSVQRAWRPDGVARQLHAIVAHGDRSALLAGVRVPTALIHGSADPLVRVAAAHDLQRKIAGASLDAIDGMGHDLPPALLPRFAAIIARNATRS
jgi:pimeloyl-ACP methyl ester carboxylesterase